jgi:hypothetical protein
MFPLGRTLRRARQARSVGGSSKRASRVILHWRDSGPVWYEASFFERLGRQPELLDTLLSGDLDWYWHYDGPKDPLEHLTSETASALRKDLQDFLEPTDSSFELIGVGTDANEGSFSPQSYRAALSKFSSDEGGPIEIVVVQEGDMLFDCIFVPHEPSKAVQQLLRVWGISENVVRDKHEDRGTFEALFQL